MLECDPLCAARHLQRVADHHDGGAPVDRGSIVRVKLFLADKETRRRARQDAAAGAVVHGISIIRSRTRAPSCTQYSCGASGMYAGVALVWRRSGEAPPLTTNGIGAWRFDALSQRRLITGPSMYLRVRVSGKAQHVPRRRPVSGGESAGDAPRLADRWVVVMRGN